VLSGQQQDLLTPNLFEHIYVPRQQMHRIRDQLCVETARQEQVQELSMLSSSLFFFFFSSSSSSSSLNLVLMKSSSNYLLKKTDFFL
jgi:hypothetical protein